MITAKNVSKKYSDTDILTGVNCKIGTRKKIGLVGRNGCGKSTLFKMIAGIEEISGGTIDMQEEILGYVPQEFHFPDEIVGEYLEKKLESQWDSYKIENLVTKLQFHNYDPYQNLNTLSEGQKMKVKLIEVLLNDPTTLLIDEPTNHLDIEGIMWFEEYLSHLNKSVLMISHDRSFLNHSVDEIWEIDKKQVFLFVGDYDNYRNEKLKLIDKWNQEYVHFLKKKEQLETLLQNVRKIKDGKSRGKAISAAKKRIEREVTGNTKELYVSKTIKDVNFNTKAHQGKLMIRFKDVSKSYGNKKVFSDMNFELRGKEKLWIYGPNGAGKSTMVKMIMGEEKTTSGDITIGENIKIGYFSQTQSHLGSKNEILTEFISKTGCEYGKAFGYLSKFMFDKNTVKKRVEHLSPGERARFAFSIFAYNDYDLLILDEPDNHLDIETKEVIERSLSEFKGAILLVSHDRYFVEMIGIDKVLNLKDGKLSLY